jgi:hypothetical protein
MNPNTLNADGTCPECGRAVEQSQKSAAMAERDKAPWHFKLILAITVIYLTWRIIQLIMWVVS